MVVPVLAAVLVVAALAVGVVGVLAATHRLPRNRVIGVRTGWTMARVDAFRRANRVAAPAFVGAGVLGLAAGVAAMVSPVTTAAVTLLVVGALGLVVLLGVGGAVGGRYAEADRAATLEAENRPAQPCSVPVPDDGCGAAEQSACAGSCAICPRSSS
ncbi:SdpI family protein [Actinomycetospora termitidis]|uniref:SdpI family protein n=1 Tax=Actinomycetospora termitidis TaxID=3053470 RepID=A0ABT7M2K0_9PSEU|nr:SdpI family protein [Actinomycetospora sp. Odt1-22]MDL5154876.1 SdpI family protein [Actinomycetospora sp. Odt1-22]